MKKWCILLLFAFTQAACSSPNKKTNEKILAAQPQEKKWNFSISPDGQFLSYKQSWKNRDNIFIQKLSADRLPDGEPIQITYIEDRDIGGYVWVTDSVMAYTRDQGGDENFHLFNVNLKTKVTKNLTPFAHTRALMLDGLDGISETEALITMNRRNPKIKDVYRLNLVTGELQMIYENPGETTEWLIDRKGQIRVITQVEGLQTKVLTRENDTQEFKEILKFSYKDHFQPLAFSFDNRFIYASSNIGRDKKAIVEVDPVTGKEKKILFKHPIVDVDRLSFSKRRKLVTGVSFRTWKKEIKFLDPIFEKQYRKIKKQIGDLEIGFGSSNSEEDLFIIEAKSDIQPSQSYLYDVVNDRLTLLSDPVKSEGSVKRSVMKPIRYRSRDGLTIHGYLTLPNGKSQKNLPIIVKPHGGPWARDIWQYDPEVQFLAGLGYGVLQMNFRGSTGYGKKFWLQSSKQWGKAMQNDITDGVRWLIDSGIADPKRIAIYGKSYGGYAALAGVAFTPNLYACAIDYAGISNLLTAMNSIRPDWTFKREKFFEMIGDPSKDEEYLKSVSPVFHAHQIKVPLLVIQGKHDPSVNVEEANQIVNEIKKRDGIVEYLLIENEGHTFSNSENISRMHDAIRDFLAKYL